MQPTFFWHDYETSGADPRRDRPLQFAGLRTTLDLEPVGEPVVAWCKPAPDVLPHPDAVLLTGIAPQDAERNGLVEAEFTRVVHAELAEPGTCGVGYNSVRFDDQVTRNLLYRNFHDPYAREWENGNSRWDLIDLVRLAHALRPQGLEWPRHPDGSPSFRLGDLATANGIEHGHAHDALSDVLATLGLARRLRAAQPRLFDYHLGLRDRRRALALLDWVKRTPVLHVSSRYPASRGCLAVVVPLAELPGQPNAVVVYDLDTPPDDLIALDVDAIRDRLFTPRADLPDGVARVPLKVVRANHCPALAPLSVLRGADPRRFGLDVDRALAHADRLARASDVAAKARAVFAMPPPPAAAVDPELALYSGGFPSDADRALCADVRRSSPERLATHAFPFRDARYTELLFRYRARNWPDTLAPDERERWRAFRAARLTRETGLASITLDAYTARLRALRLDPSVGPREQVLLDALDAWGRAVAASL
jgi:exodeoxyribonuclease-1